MKEGGEESVSHSSPDTQMDGWMDGWMGGWVDGWMDGWMDGRNRFVQLFAAAGLVG